jgi:hypothetical protein
LLTYVERYALADLKAAPTWRQIESILDRRIKDKILEIKAWKNIDESDEDDKNGEEEDDDDLEEADNGESRVDEGEYGIFDSEEEDGEVSDLDEWPAFVLVSDLRFDADAFDYIVDRYPRSVGEYAIKFELLEDGGMPIRIVPGLAHGATVGCIRSQIGEWARNPNNPGQKHSVLLDYDDSCIFPCYLVLTVIVYQWVF